MHRRTVLALPALTGLAVLAACGPDPQETAVPASSGGTQHIAYGEDPSQFGELTLPSGDPRGVAVVVHGGFWRAEYGIEYGRPLVPSLVERGWAVWDLEYRRVGNGGGVPETLDDITAALATLDDLDLPSDGPVVGIGHSAGGHLVTWAASGGRLTHVVAQAGVLDLGSAYDEGLGGGAVERLLGHAYGPADAAVDPIQQVPLAVPVWCIHARDDDVVPISQSRAYVDAANAAGAPAELVELDSGGHFAVIDPDSEAWARTLAILDRW